jgi:hypothetical protein
MNKVDSSGKPCIRNDNLGVFPQAVKAAGLKFYRPALTLNEPEGKTMHYMMIVKASPTCEAGKKPSMETISAILNYTHELRKAGALVELSRLQPSSKGVRVKLLREKAVVTDGPFTETKEVIGGYWIIKAESMNEAVEWAKRVPGAHGGDEDMVIEVRQFMELEEFIPGEAMAPAFLAGKASAQATAQKQSH